MIQKKVYALLLAGGNGERLWPLSRKDKPKQLLHLEEETTLIENTIARIEPLIPQEKRWVLTTEACIDTIENLVDDKVGLISVEPLSRNTGPSILLNCLSIYQENPDAYVVVMPTDHFIPAKKIFTEFLTHAIDSVCEYNKIVLLGAKPSYAATGYGYIEYTPANSMPWHVKTFHEKPTIEKAHEYVQSESMLWNTGIFCAPVSLLLQEFKTHAPELYHGVQRYMHDEMPYDDLPSISIDYAVMEKSKELMVLPLDCVWYDVGNLARFMALRDAQRKGMQDIIAIESHNNLIEVENTLVALIGIENLCIVQTDDILLIAKRDETEKIKLIVDTLKLNKSDEYL